MSYNKKGMDASNGLYQPLFQGAVAKGPPWSGIHGLLLSEAPNKSRCRVFNGSVFVADFARKFTGSTEYLPLSCT